MVPARADAPREKAPLKQQSRKSATRRDRLLLMWRLTNSAGNAVASRYAISVSWVAKYSAEIVLDPVAGEMDKKGVVAVSIREEARKPAPE